MVGFGMETANKEPFDHSVKERFLA